MIFDILGARWLMILSSLPTCVDGMKDRVGLDQTVALQSVWSGSALFAQTCLS